MYQRTIDVTAAVIVHEALALPNRQYQWVVALEVWAVGVNDSPVVSKRIIEIDRFRVRGFV